MLSRNLEERMKKFRENLQKLWTYFRRLRNSMAILSANISGEEYNIDNR